MRRQFDGSPAGRDFAVTVSNIDWAGVRGATQVDGTLFYGRAGMLYRAPFDGTHFGPSTPVDPYRDPQWCSVPHRLGHKCLLRQASVVLRRVSTDVTAIAFNKGRLYYTLAPGLALSGAPVEFSPESGIVGAVSHRVSRDPVAGIAAADDRGWPALSTGTGPGVLRRVGLTDQALVGPSKYPERARGSMAGPGVPGRASWGSAPASSTAPPAAGPPSRPVITKVRSTGRTAVVVRWRAAVPATPP